MEVLISGKRINYDVIGQGVPILFVHGWGRDANKVWLPLVELLKSKYKCYLIDLPGMGKSENPDSNWGVEEYSNLVRDFALQMNLKGCIYIGRSFGGTLGVYISSEFRDMFGKYVLIAPSWRRKGRKNSAQASNFWSKFNWIFKIGLLRYLKYKIFYPESSITKFWHLESNFRKIVTQDLTEYAKKIKSELLILQPELDEDVDMNNSVELNGLVKGSKLVLYPGQTHRSVNSKPEVIINDIIEFIRI